MWLDQDITAFLENILDNFAYIFEHLHIIILIGSSAFVLLDWNGQ